MTNKIVAPWTADQVAKLNHYQTLTYLHEYTCANNHFGQRRLIAKADGWHCGICGYRQTWAHEAALRPPPDPIRTMKKLVGDKPALKNPQALCRDRSNESGMRGECLRCGVDQGVACLDSL